MSTPDPDWLTVDDLLACAQGTDCTVSARQIERWRKADLLPHPRRIALGRGKGMRSEYPPSACAQLVALCRLRNQGEARLHHLRFALWQQGYPVPVAAVKETLERLVFRPFHSVRPLDQDPHEIAVQAAITMMPHVPRSKVGRAVRQHLRNDAEVQHVFTALMQLVLGSGPVFTQPPAAPGAGATPLAELVIRAMGLDAARTEGIGDAGPWLTTDSGEDLARLEQQGMFASDHLLEVLRVASLTALERARADAAIFGPGFAALTQALHATGAPEVFGWVFRLGNQADPAVLVRQIIGFLAVRQLMGDDPLDTVLMALAQQLPRLRAIVGLLAAAPDLAPLLHPQRGTEAFTALAPATRENSRQRIVQLLAEHPDWAAALATEEQISPDVQSKQ